MRAVVFCALPFAGSATMIIVLAAIQGVATGFFRPAVYAGMPNLVDDEQLPAATSLLQTIENLTWMIGPVIGGVILSAWGPDLAYWVNAVTFVVSALLLARIPAARLQVGHVESRGHWADIGDGFRVVVHTRALLTVLVVWNVVTLGVGAINVAEVALAKVSLDAGNIGFGILARRERARPHARQLRLGQPRRPVRDRTRLLLRDRADGGRATRLRRSRRRSTSPSRPS